MDSREYQRLDWGRMTTSYGAEIAGTYHYRGYNYRLTKQHKAWGAEVDCPNCRFTYVVPPSMTYRSSAMSYAQTTIRHMIKKGH